MSTNFEYGGQCICMALVRTKAKRFRPSRQCNLKNMTVEKGGILFKTGTYEIDVENVSILH